MTLCKYCERFEAKENSLFCSDECKDAQKLFETRDYKNKHIEIAGRHDE